MRRVLALSLLLVFPANAWDGFNRFEAPTTGATSGGGGLWGTGAKREQGVTCASCHVKPKGQVYASIEFLPLLMQVGPQSLYLPGQRYTITVTMKNESLGRPYQTCAPGLRSANGFAASFETATGLKAGRLESDTGQDSLACPASIPDQQMGTTVTYGSCTVIAATMVEDLTVWTFKWTAPGPGAGPITMNYALVDGNCDAKSTGDDVRIGTVVMAQGQ